MTPDHRPLRSRARGQDGFTLIELLVTIVILGVLAAIVVFSVRGIGDKGRGSAVAADAATLRTAEEAYCAKYGRYATADELKAKGLLGGDPVYNTVVVGQEGKCGQGPNSSYTVYDAGAPTEREEQDIAVGAGPADLAVDEKTDRVYVVSGGAPSVTVIDGRTDKPVGAPVDLTSAVAGPTRVAVVPGTGKVYVGGTDGVALVDTADGGRVTRIENFSAPVTALGIAPDTGDLYVAGGSLNTSALAYVPRGETGAKPIALPAQGLVSASNGMDFTFDAARHAVYFAKAGIGSGTTPAAKAGLFAVSTETRQARTVVDFPTKTSCGTSGDLLLANTVRGRTVVDPIRNLVYLLARRCAPDGTGPEAVWKPVATVVVVNPATGEVTQVDDPAGTPYGAVTAAYNAAVSSVYVYFSGGTHCAGSGGRVDRFVGTRPTGQAQVCAMSAAAGNHARKMAVLGKYNRVFVAQFAAAGPGGTPGPPGGIGSSDAGTLLTGEPLGTPDQFGALAVNEATAKLYAVDPTANRVVVFRTGKA
ncbi:prepilin-type N-terminal cleavage/methylation domain-containing protein [Streptomyces sp. NPDC048659]|uniref:prepilin-type N-terminal cleavage/methylation domain-containing protein n=1 Tax=Streptomyces sp. NPDC048659 TaxID=3155489 RepID=UPI003445B42A